MAGPESSWTSEHSRRFSDHNLSMRGYVRYEVVHQNLADTLAEFLSTPKRIIDIGGGEGIDAKWIARVGADHSVYLLEPDRESRQAAVRGNNGLVQIMDGSSQTALDQYGVNSFDLVLSHGVMQYFPENPEAELHRLTSLVRPGGYISLLNPGLFGKINRYSKAGNQSALLRLEATHKYRNNNDAESLAWLPQEITAMLEQETFRVVDWFGVRLHSDNDYRPVEEVPIFHFNRTLESELRDSRDPSLRSAGQMLHFIAQKLEA